MDNLSINPNLRSLSLKTFDYTDAFALLEYTPNLKFFKLITGSFARCYRLKKCSHLSKVKLENIDLTYEPMLKNHDDTYRMYFLLLTNLLKQFSSSLIFLSMNSKDAKLGDFQIDGIILQQQLLESMIHLKTFHLYVEQHFNENILSTFKNPFFFDHQWSVEMHDKYLYTVPFHFAHIKLTNSMIFNSSQTWPRLTSIELSEYINLNFIKQLRMKMPNLRTITLNSSSNCDLDEFNETDTRLASVTTICFKVQVNKCVQQCLSEILPNVKELILYGLYAPISTINEKIERLIIRNGLIYSTGDREINCIYLPNVKHLEIQCDDLKLSLMTILKNFKNLKTLTLYFDPDWYNRFYPKSTCLNDLWQIDLIEILEEYQIKEDYKYIRFIRKTND